MPKISSATKNEEYCVLFREEKGYYLSKTKVAVSMGLKHIFAGSKKECESFIDNKKTEIIEEEK
ncbi:MAG: hypothetical protein ACHQJ4_01035 [Ignavibacteria bacterium]